jgi:hypothetical protein
MIYSWFYVALSAAGLSPYERFEAMRNMDATPQSGLYALLTNKWFIILGFSVIFFLLLVLASIRLQKREKDRLKQIRMFEEKANLFGLTPEERELLQTIAQLAHQKQMVNIYFRPGDFDAGMSRYLRKMLAAQTDEEIKKQQISMLESIKYKIGFVRKNVSYKGRFRRSQYLTSRQIPVNTEVTLCPNTHLEGREYKVTVVSNEITGIEFQTSQPLPFQAGDACTIQYMIGAVLWGFDVVVLGSDGTKLKVCHVDHARYINRRRFVRVPLHQPIWVAPFAVFTEQSKPSLPSFSKAEIAEFSGPTLRLRGILGVQRKDRVLVIFEIEPGRVVQDIAEVQRIGQTGTGPFYVVELTGLDDHSEDELIRITNQSAIEQGMDLDADREPDGSEMEMTAEVGAS